MTEIDTTPTTARGWRGQAACRDVDPELFFPVATAGSAYEEQVAASKAVCAGCPVRAECLVEALARIPYGIAGGLTEQERHRLRTGQPTTRSTSAVAEEVLVDGPPPGMTAGERAGVGRILLAAGRSARQVAGDCGVCPRTVQRWATTPTTRTSTTSSGTSTTAGSTGEGSRGGHRAPLQISQHHHTQAGTSAPEGARG